jgi:hypothetical protein
MIKVKDIIQKISKDQFVIRELLKDNKPFAITESTPENHTYKILCIDFGKGISRYITLDNLLLILKEMYGNEYIIKAMEEIKSYDDVKDKIISDKSFEELLSR